MANGSKSSLILKEQAEVEAAPFFPDFDLPEVDRAKPKFHCTGERLFRDRRDVYDAVVRLLAEPGVTIRTICRTCHVTDDVVRSVRAREDISIAHEKKNVLGSITHGLRLAAERVIEVMPEASAKDALLGVGILTEKMQLLDSAPTAIVAFQPAPSIFEDWDGFIQKQLEPDDVIELPSETGSVGEKEKTNSTDPRGRPSLLTNGETEDEADGTAGPIEFKFDRRDRPNETPSTSRTGAAARQEAAI